MLRLLRAHHDPTMIRREEAAQNATAAQGYPAPRVLLSGLDPAALGAPFAIMARAESVPLLSRVVGMAGVLARARLRLHALDPTSLRGVVPDLDGYLDRQARRIEAASLEGLRPLVDWLRAQRPAPEPVVICHGDFHPQNLLVHRGEVQRHAAPGVPVTVLDRSPYVPRLLARAARITGLDLSRPW